MGTEPGCLSDHHRQHPFQEHQPPGTGQHLLQPAVPCALCGQGCGQGWPCGDSPEEQRGDHRHRQCHLSHSCGCRDSQRVPGTVFHCHAKVPGCQAQGASQQELAWRSGECSSSPAPWDYEDNVCVKPHPSMHCGVLRVELPLSLPLRNWELVGQLREQMCSWGIPGETQTSGELGWAGHCCSRAWGGCMRLPSLPGLLSSAVSCAACCRIHILVQIPHQDGMLPLISTLPLHNLHFLLCESIYKHQHVCSNLVTVRDLRGISEEGFLDGVTPDSLVLGVGYDHPYQLDPVVREPKTIQLYQHLKSCIWPFAAYYDMTELIDVCGGSVAADFQVQDSAQSFLTVHVPLYVSYIYVTAPRGWASLEHHTEMEFSFFYDTVLWRTGIQTDSVLSARLQIIWIYLRDSGHLVIEFKTQAKFRGLFVMEHHSLPDVRSSLVNPEHLGGIEFDLQLLWSAQTFDWPNQLLQQEGLVWRVHHLLDPLHCPAHTAMGRAWRQAPALHGSRSRAVRRPHPHGSRTVSAPLGCLWGPSRCVGHTTAAGMERRGLEPPLCLRSLPATRSVCARGVGTFLGLGCTCVQTSPVLCSLPCPNCRFLIPITFQQTNHPVPVVYSLYTEFQLCNNEKVFRMDPTKSEMSLAETVYKGAFSKG
ncbi:extracellular matrix organizing protein FRAS1-like isoform X2 [Pithys albifrons albifrons]|uniref:extracellular matrix organizing protein FRAS1-like isoform X2 n=1 Tax=Pithys albifrons albifrons TaxID=3385563 RepID=UPI003A5D0628